MGIYSEVNIFGEFDLKKPAVSKKTQNNDKNSMKIVDAEKKASTKPMKRKLDEELENNNKRPKLDDCKSSNEKVSIIQKSSSEAQKCSFKIPKLSDKRKANEGHSKKSEFKDEKLKEVSRKDEKSQKNTTSGKIEKVSNGKSQNKEGNGNASEKSKDNSHQKEAKTLTPRDNENKSSKSKDRSEKRCEKPEKESKTSRPKEESKKSDDQSKLKDDNQSSQKHKEMDKNIAKETSKRDKVSERSRKQESSEKPKSLKSEEKTTKESIKSSRKLESSEKSKSKVEHKTKRIANESSNNSEGRKPESLEKSKTSKDESSKSSKNKHSSKEVKSKSSKQQEVITTSHNVPKPVAEEPKPEIKASVVSAKAESTKSLEETPKQENKAIVDSTKSVVQETTSISNEKLQLFRKLYEESMNHGIVFSSSESESSEEESEDEEIVVQSSNEKLAEQAKIKAPEVEQMSSRPEGSLKLTIKLEKIPKLIEEKAQPLPEVLKIEEESLTQLKPTRRVEHRQSFNGKPTNFEQMNESSIEAQKPSQNSVDAALNEPQRIEENYLIPKPARRVQHRQSFNGKSSKMNEKSMRVQQSLQNQEMASRNEQPLRRAANRHSLGDMTENRRRNEQSSVPVQQQLFGYPRRFDIKELTDQWSKDLDERLRKLTKIFELPQISDSFIQKPQDNPRQVIQPQQFVNSREAYKAQQQIVQNPIRIPQNSATQVQQRRFEIVEQNRGNQTSKYPVEITETIKINPQNSRNYNMQPTVSRPLMAAPQNQTKTGNNAQHPTKAANPVQAPFKPESHIQPPFKPTSHAQPPLKPANHVQPPNVQTQALAKQQANLERLKEAFKNISCTKKEPSKKNTNQKRLLNIGRIRTAIRKNSQAKFQEKQSPNNQQEELPKENQSEEMFTKIEKFYKSPEQIKPIEVIPTELLAKEVNQPKIHNSWTSTSNSFMLSPPTKENPKGSVQQKISLDDLDVSDDDSDSDSDSDFEDEVDNHAARIENLVWGN